MKTRLLTSQDFFKRLCGRIRRNADLVAPPFGDREERDVAVFGSDSSVFPRKAHPYGIA